VVNGLVITVVVNPPAFRVVTLTIKSSFDGLNKAAAFLAVVDGTDFAESLITLVLFQFLAIPKDSTVDAALITMADALVPSIAVLIVEDFEALQTRTLQCSILGARKSAKFPAVIAQYSARHPVVEVGSKLRIRCGGWKIGYLKGVSHSKQ
jgi:hypothetical protein